MLLWFWRVMVLAYSDCRQRIFFRKEFLSSFFEKRQEICSQYLLRFFYAQLIIFHVNAMALGVCITFLPMRYSSSPNMQKGVITLISISFFHGRNPYILYRSAQEVLNFSPFSPQQASQLYQDDEDDPSTHLKRASVDQNKAHWDFPPTCWFLQSVLSPPI